MRKFNCMKTLYIFLATLLIFISCKEAKKSAPDEIAEEKSVMVKIAEAHGFQNWKKVNNIHFTFNVDRDTAHFERSWIWDIRNNTVTGILGADTLSYKRTEVDSTTVQLDAGFINDKYWLLAPFNLIWDDGNYTFEHSEEALAPISTKPMQKLTIVYSNEGGYTPGDAYDFFFEDDYIIKEWVFRKGNQDDPSTITTWEAYDEYGGLLLSREHKKSDGSFTLSFTNIKVD